MKNQQDIIKKISNRWFLTDPLLFMTFMSQEVKQNEKLRYPVRSGQGRIEYNFGNDNFSEAEIEENLRAEVIRILLRHPYRRHEKKNIAYMASNITLNENYEFNFLKYNVKDIWGSNQKYTNRNFEFYYSELLNEHESSKSSQNEDSEENNEKKIENNSEHENNREDTDKKSDTKENKENDLKGGNDAEHGAKGEGKHDDENNNGDENIDSNKESNYNENDYKEDTDSFENNNNEEISSNYDETTHTVECSALWEEDDFMNEKLKEIVEWTNTNMQWGTLPQNLIQHLIASLKPKIDYRKIINSFRASVLTSDKILTRFRQSRRYGFLYMGKKNEFKTNLLIAMDVSASISDKDIRIFYSVINRFFKYGIRSIDVIQFDVDVKLPLLKLKKAKKEIIVHGRGGTCFGSVIEFFENRQQYQFDGLIIFTDGEAPIPKMKTRTIRKTLWICNNKENYELHSKWMKKCGRCCWIEK